MSDHGLHSTRRLEGGHLTEVISPRSERDHADILALAARYRRVAVPGVVSIHSFRGDPDPILILSLPGDESWDSLPPPLATIPWSGAQVATALAQVHARGVTHGAVGRNTIIVDSRSNPVLSGFAHESPPSPAADVRALAQTIADMVADQQATSPDEEKLADRLADVCRKTLDHKNPTAARLADDLAAAQRPNSRTRRRVAVAIGLAIGLVGLVWGRYPAPIETDQTAAPTVVEPSTTARPVAPTATTAATAATAATTTNRPSLPPATSTTVPGPAPTLRYDGRTWSAGHAGDVVVVADWRCTGRPAVMAARPGTGEVFLWRDWPVGGSEAGERIGLVPTLTGFADPPIRKCDVVTVVTESGLEQLRPETTR
ncbi:MAG: hypothetical protein ACR2QE_01255 [Acidimicrobiales bacterium]